MYIGGTSKAKDGLPDSCKEACVCAISLLEVVSHQISKGDITIEVLEKINKHLQQMERLCVSVQNETQKSVNCRMHAFVKLRLEEFEAFQEQLNHLQHVCYQLENHDIIGKQESVP